MTRTTTLLVTKTVPPTLSSRQLRRPRLYAALDAGAERKVTLVLAPAGFGKTALVAGWLAAGTGRKAGWVSLDSSDDEPSRF
jgi:LuxR family transcriptional regulator, maltose regulon positive regulatory protein